MQPTRSLLIVNFRSASLTREAIRTARAASSEPLDVVVVDNTCDAAEAEALSHVGADEIIVADRNLGYAGGINRGTAKCQGAIVVVANPDVLFRARSIDLLADGLDVHVAITGPAFTWDDSDGWFLPPAEMTTAATKLADLLSEYAEPLRLARDRIRTRERIRFWSTVTSRRVPALSGAVICFKTSLFRDVGPFDERFSLYFEEIDFMRRVRLTGRDIVYVPGAVCRHLYSQSAGDSERSTYAISEIEYLRKWEGDGFVRLMKWIGRRREESLGFETRRPDDPLMLPGSPGDYVIEISPDPRFSSAAGHFPTREVVLIPAECWATYRSEELFIRIVDKVSGAAHSGWRVVKNV